MLTKRACIQNIEHVFLSLFLTQTEKKERMKEKMNERKSRNRRNEEQTAKRKAERGNETGSTSRTHKHMTTRGIPGQCSGLAIITVAQCVCVCWGVGGGGGRGGEREKISVRIGDGVQRVDIGIYVCWSPTHLPSSPPPPGLFLWL